jgi:hypothetical protein
VKKSEIKILKTIEIMKLQKIKLNHLSDSQMSIEEQKLIIGGAAVWDPVLQAYVLDEVVVTPAPTHSITDEEWLLVGTGALTAGKETLRVTKSPQISLIVTAAVGAVLATAAYFGH